MLDIKFDWDLVLVSIAAIAIAIAYAFVFALIYTYFVKIGSKNRRPIDSKDLVRIKMPTLTWPSDIGKPAMAQKYIMMYAPTACGTPRQLFESLGVSLDLLCFDFDELSKNAKDLLILSGGSFIALYKKKKKISNIDEYFVYYGFRCNKDYEINIPLFESNLMLIKPLDNIGIFVPKLTKSV